MLLIQVVGYKNSGKTTLASRLIKLYADKGIRVASLKHHGHGGVPIGIEDTDSEKHRQAGAVLSGVEGGGVFQLATKQPLDVDKMIAFYELFDIEVVVIEGYKKLNFDKIVLIRNEDDLHLLKLSNIKAVVTSIPIKQTDSYPIFKNQTDVCGWIDQQFPR